MRPAGTLLPPCDQSLARRAASCTMVSRRREESDSHTFSPPLPLARRASKKLLDWLKLKPGTLVRQD